ncbi:hypothetical protein VKS41_000177 [Umbelopsis sp. WA50703]
MEDIISYHFASVKQRHENRHEMYVKWNVLSDLWMSMFVLNQPNQIGLIAYSDYQLSVRQQPKQSRMCGIGEKADRRPVDPPRE